MTDSKLICQKCGARLAAGALFCPACGTKVQPVVAASPTGANKCPGCGVELAKDAKFCPVCGKPAVSKPEVSKPAQFKPPIKCLGCGYMLDADAKFCPECGKVVASVPAAAPVPTPVQAPVVNKCSECGTELIKDARFCPVCGKSAVSAPMQAPVQALVQAPAPVPTPVQAPVTNKCSECGTILAKDARFCPVCGKPAMSVSPEVASAPVPIIEKKPSSPPPPEIQKPEKEVIATRETVEVGQGGSTTPDEKVEKKPEGAVVCSKCGAQMAVGAQFCGLCGGTAKKEEPKKEDIKKEDIKKEDAKAKIVCKKCQAEVAEGMAFCGKCGTKVQAQKPCPHCGTMIDEGKEICEACSAKQAEQETQAKPNLCPQCGATLVEGIKFCGSCGAKVIVTMKEELISPPEVVPVKPAEEVLPAKLEVSAPIPSSPAIPQVPPEEEEVAKTLLTGGAVKVPKKWKLLIKSIAEQKEVELIENNYTLGRSPKCQIPIKDDRVSHQHVRLFQHDDQWFVHDLGSTNGTYVNGQKMVTITEFKVGDKVRIGKTELKLTCQEILPRSSDKGPGPAPTKLPSGGTPPPAPGSPGPGVQSHSANDESHAVVQQKPVSEETPVPSVMPPIEAAPQPIISPAVLSVRPKGSRMGLLFGGMVLILIMIGLAGLYFYEKYRLENPQPYINVDSKMVPKIEDSISLFNNKLWLADYKFSDNNRILRVIYEDIKGQYIDTRLEWDSTTESIIIPDITEEPLGQSKALLAQFIDEQMANKSILAKLRNYMRSRAT